MDLKLKELKEEVERCNTLFNEATTEKTTKIATYELLAAEERLNLYLKERKMQ